MSLTQPKKRELLKAAYPSERWSLKVDFMKNDQVTAILLSLIKQGKVKI